MPKLIEYITDIARAKGRDVLLLSFPSCESFEVRYDDCAARTQVIDWLDANGFDWIECALPANSGYLSYVGNLYIDVPYDEANPEYKKLAEFLENPDGSSRIEDVRFLVLPLPRG